jgi:hypothetical protein
VTRPGRCALHARSAVLLGLGLGLGLAMVCTQALANLPSCQMTLTEHRTGRELARVPLDLAQLSFELRFVHSVLQTPVVDRYRWQRDAQGAWYAELQHETFEGHGYGLPHTASSGERLIAHEGGHRLVLARRVDPLVVRPLPMLGMQLQLDGAAALPLSPLTTQAIHVQLLGCSPTASRSNTAP